MARKTKLSIYLVSSMFYKDISEKQIRNVTRVIKNEVPMSNLNINIVQTEGSLEIPFIVNRICKKKKPDGIIALGCIIKGKTNHYQTITESVSNNLIQLSLKYDIPITSGVLSVTDKKLIKSRTDGGAKDRAIEAAKSLLELIKVCKDL